MFRKISLTSIVALLSTSAFAINGDMSFFVDEKDLQKIYEESKTHKSALVVPTISYSKAQRSRMKNPQAYPYGDFLTSAMQTNQREQLKELLKNGQIATLNKWANERNPRMELFMFRDGTKHYEGEVFAGLTAKEILERLWDRHDNNKTRRLRNEKGGRAVKFNKEQFVSGYDALSDIYGAMLDVDADGQEEMILAINLEDKKFYGKDVHLFTILKENQSKTDFDLIFQGLGDAIRIVSMDTNQTEATLRVTKPATVLLSHSFEIQYGVSQDYSYLLPIPYANGGYAMKKIKREGEQ